jgi:hypothetical protein
MISFVTYVLSFKDSDCALGDVARDMMFDSDIRKSWGYPRLIVHLMHKNAVADVYAVLEEARLNYLCG